MNCFELNSVTISNSLTSIGFCAFNNCQNLTELTCLSETPPSCEELCFDEVPTETCVVKVPASAVDAYKAADGWKDFENIVAIDEPDYIAMSINDQEVMQGKTINIPVFLNNNRPVLTFQCDIVLPEGLSIEKNVKGKYNINLSDRSDEHIISSSVQNNGYIRVISYSNDNNEYIGTNGVLFNIPFEVPEQIEVGTEAIIKITNISVTDENLTRVNLPDTEAKLTITPAFTPGDVDGDGEYSTTDIAIIVSFIMSKGPEGVTKAAADLDNDNEITTTDIAIVVSYILQGKSIN